MPLTLELMTPPEFPLEIAGLTPAAVGALSAAGVARWPLAQGNRTATLADFYQLSGSASDGELRFLGDHARVHGLGAGLDSGSLLIEGNAGRHVGSRMTAGRIEIRGTAGDWLGAEMHGGEIRVRGDAGHLVGGAYRGSLRGMTGGAILVDGNAGQEVGCSMRRGMIALGGDAGEMPGCNMLAGSIYVGGACGARPGAGMKRGSIVCLGSRTPRLLPTFPRAGTDTPDFLRIACRSLAERGFRLDPALSAARFTLYHGDFLELGRGEIWIRN